MKNKPIPIHEFEREQQNAPRIKLIPFNEVKLGTARRYLVKGLVPRIGLVVIWGPPKSGKSFWTFDLAMHIALGWDYRGRRVQQGPVVYAAFEGASGLETRIEAFRQKRLPTIPGHIPFYLEPVTLDLVADHGELITAIRRQVKEEDGPPSAVVLDTLNRSLRGSESSDEDMGAYVKAADVIREAFQCAVIVVHHCGIAADRPRGHTSLTGAVDAQLSVKRNAEDVILVTVELMKDGPQGEVLASNLEQVEVGIDEDGDTITSCVITETDTPETKSRSKLDAASKIALDLLTRAIADGGEIPAANNHIPPDKRCVSENLWRRYCYAGQITESDKQETKQRTYKRVADKLQKLELIGVWQDWVWLTR